MRKPEMVATPEDFPGLASHCPICGVENMPHTGTLDKEDNMELGYTCGCGKSWWKKDSSPFNPSKKKWGEPGRLWGKPGRPKSIK
jgi:transposase-like protein